jgi:hypothetical protein
MDFLVSLMGLDRELYVIAVGDLLTAIRLLQSGLFSILPADS